MQYRPDIDGLRALAILAVVGGHAGLPGLAGGFTGVDAFFVISGFLITSLLRAEQKRSGKIDILAFYARRVRRLVPALGLVLLVTLVAGFLLLSPDGEQQALAASTISVTTFVSNMYFGLSRLGYFVASGQFLPLLHTWSLGVEEQFYLVWPVLMIIGAAVSRRWKVSFDKVLFPLLALGAAVSLILCFIMLEVSQAVAFYAFPTRAWELGAGALLAFLPRPAAARPVVGGVMTATGALAFASVVIVHQHAHLFTAAPSLVAVIGAVLMIGGGSLAPRSLPTRLLSATPMVWIGKLSYAWYLWHWVLLAFARGSAMGAESLGRDLVAVVASLGLAALTWAFVEQPVRKQRLRLFASDPRSLMAGATILTVCAALAGLLWLWADHRLAGSPQAQMSVRATQSRILFSKTCEEAGSLQALLSGNCLQGAPGKKPLVVVIGDSHARHLVPGLSDLARASGVSLLPAVKSSCLLRPFPEAELQGALEREQGRCATFNQSILDGVPELKANHGLEGVIIAGMWERDRGWELVLPDYVKALRAQGLRVVLALDVPGYAFSVPRCVARHGAEACRGDRPAIERQRARDAAFLRSLAARTPGVTVWDPLDAACTTTHCDVAGGGDIFYSDPNHLSYAGSRRLTPSMRPMLNWVAGLEPRP